MPTVELRRYLVKALANEILEVLTGEFVLGVLTLDDDDCLTVWTFVPVSDPTVALLDPMGAQCWNAPKSL